MQKEVKVLRKRRVLSIFLTLIVISLLIFSGPASAITVGLERISSSNGVYTYRMVVDIHTNDHVIINLVAIRLNNVNDSTTHNCYFNLGDLTINSQYTSQSDNSTCQMINITTVTNNAAYSNTSGYGYGYGYDSTGWDTQNISWDGYGYGYATGYGYDTYSTDWRNNTGILDGEIIINFTIDTTSQTSEVGDEFSIKGGVAGIEDSQIKFTYYNDNSVDSFTIQGNLELPVVTLNTPINNYNSSSSSIQFNFTVTDNSDTSLNCNLSINDTVNISNILATNGTPQLNTTTGFNEGIYVWNVTCWDSSNNTGDSTTRTFTVDALPPTSAPRVTLVTDSNNDGNMEINWTADPNAAKYGIFRYTQNFSNISSTWRIANTSSGSFVDNTSTHDTLYWYAITSIDYAGNENLSIINITAGNNNATTNDTIIPKLTTSIIITNSSAIASINWSPVLYDIKGNPDFHELRYEIWGKSGGILNTSKNITENDFAEISNTNVYTNSTTWDIPSGCGSSCQYMFIVTSLDDAGNRNLSQNLAQFQDNLANITLTYTNTSSDDESSSSSGGGGITIKYREDEFSRGWSEVEDSLNITIDKDLIPVTLVQFEVIQEARNVQFSIKALDSHPENLPKLSFAAYSFLKITLTSWDSDVFINQNIAFKVNKSWLSENNINNDEIALYRYKGGWNNLQTTFINEDTEYSYYSAETPGFSFFAIASTKEITVSPGSKNPADDASESQPGNQSNDSSTPDEGKKTTEKIKLSNSFLTILTIILTIIISGGATAYLVFKKGKSDKKLEILDNLEIEPSFPPQLTDYIRNQLSNGFHEHHIRNALLQKGWQKEKVDQAFNHISRTTSHRSFHSL